MRAERRGTSIARFHVPHWEYQLRLVQPIAIVNSLPMLFRAVALTVAIVAMPSMASADARSESKSQVEFGIKVAQNGLWKEATYRWEKAVQLDPTYAEAWNNLAVGYEHDGRFEDADAAYQKALKLDPKNLAIRTNYDLFKEIHDRTKRRRDR
jgi:Flp pilus assembly protein TadD